MGLSTAMREEVNEKPQILVVDDSKVIRRAAVKMLGDDFHVHEAVDGLDGWQQLQRNDAISVVFSDLQMPEMSGLELLANIRNSDDDRLSAIPVIMVTGVDDTESAKRDVFDAGATDFITKPFESIDLVSRARSYTHLNRKVAELEKKAGHDELTGLFNLASFEEQGEKALSFAIRHQLQISAVYFEIIDFQDTYLKYGKTIAQQIIMTVGRRLIEVMRTEDIAARIGVARYAVLFPMTSDDKARIVIRRIRETIHQLVFNVGQEKIRVSLATGYTSADITDRQHFSQIMERAESELQKAMVSDDGENISGFFEHEEQVEQKPVITDEDIRKAFGSVLDGTYVQVPEHVLKALAEKLTPFLDYVASRSDTARTGTDDS